jgi:retron-type reverse transcriptase
VEERAVHSTVPIKKQVVQTGEQNNMICSLIGIKRNIDKADRTDGRVQNLAHYIDKDMLKHIHQVMDKGKATGIDGVDKEAYEKNPSDNIDKLIERMKNGSYQPKPSRRIYIDKDGKGRVRPLGISSYEDKLVENAIAQILTQIYEPKFYDFSYGFRSGRDCHMAVLKLNAMIIILFY